MIFLNDIQFTQRYEDSERFSAFLGTSETEVRTKIPCIMFLDFLCRSNVLVMIPCPSLALSINQHTRISPSCIPKEGYLCPKSQLYEKEECGQTKLHFVPVSSKNDSDTCGFRIRLAADYSPVEGVKNHRILARNGSLCFPGSALIII